MTEKVVLTEKQDVAIRLFKYQNRTLEEWFKHRNSSSGHFEPIKNMNADDFAKALYIGYEIEKPKLKNGDKIFYPKVNSIGTVDEDMVYWDDNSETEVEYTAHLIENGEMNLATEEDLYWLEKLNRKFVGDFRIGDIMVDREGYVVELENESEIKKADEWYRDNDFKGLYPAESFKPFNKE